jgi:hypothetical protein
MMSRRRYVFALLAATLALPASARADTIEIKPGDHIAIIGNTLADRMQHDGWLETDLQARFPDQRLVIRNLGFSGDELTLRLRWAGFGTPDQWRTRRIILGASLADGACQSDSGHTEEDHRRGFRDAVEMSPIAGPGVYDSLTHRCSPISCRPSFRGSPQNDNRDDRCHDEVSQKKGRSSTCTTTFSFTDSQGTTIPSRTATSP